MKKLYSLMLALFAVCGLALAQTDVEWVASEQGYENAEKITGFDFDTNLIAIVDKGEGSTDPAYYNTGTGLRLYGGNSLTITAQTGSVVNITEVVITYSGASNAGNISTDVGTYSLTDATGTWTGDEQSVTFTRATGSGHVRIQKIAVTYNTGTVNPDYVAKPTFSPAAGTYYEPQTVSISAAEDCVVWYTTDGSSPLDATGMMTESAQMYEGPITVNGTTTITAIAVKPSVTAFLASDVATATYTIEQLAIYGSIARMKGAAQTLGTEKQPCQMNTNGLTVIGAKDRNLYVVDYTGEGILLYGANTMNLVVGDMIGGTIKGKLQLYNGSVELGDVDFSGMSLNQQGVDVEPTAATIAELMGDNRLNYESSLVKVSGLTFGATALSSKNITAKDASGAEITIRDNYGVLADYPFSTSATYDITGIVSYYNGVTQLFPRTADEVVKVSGGDDPEPQPYQLVGDGSLTNPYTVEDINSLTVPDGGTANGENKVWVKAQIIGFANGGFSDSKVVFGSSEAIASNIVIIDEANVSVVAAPELKYCAPVALANSTNADKAIRAALNLADNPNLVGQTVWLYGDITKYFGVNGVKNLESYSFDGRTILPAEEEEPEPTICYTIAQMKDIVANEPTVEYIFRSAIVQYVDNNNVYLYDGTDGLQLFKQQGGTFTVGSIVCGTIKGQIKLYNGGVEFNAPTCEGIVEIQGVAVDGTPQEVQVGVLSQDFDNYSNELVSVKNLIFQSTALDGKNILAMEVTGAPITIRDNFGVLTDMEFDTNALYDVTGFATCYAKDGEITLQLFPRSTDDIIKVGGDEPEPVLSWTADTVKAGNFILYNVGSGQYFTKGNAWGTQASIGDEASALHVELIPVGSNWFIRTGVDDAAYGLEYLAGEQCYTDQSRNKQSTWTFIEVGYNNGPVYAIVSADDHGGGAGAYLAANADDTVVGPASDETSPYAQWQLIDFEKLNAARRAALLAEMAKATENNPVDATGLIGNPNFTVISSDWTMEANRQNLHGGLDSNPCAESWCSSFTLSQTISLPNGIYELSAQAAVQEYTVTGEDLPVIYANNATMPFAEKTGSETSMSQMSESFTNGSYNVGPIRIAVIDGQLTIGAKGTRTDTWACWDNFTLKYFGASDGFELIAYRDMLNDAIKAAEEVAAGSVPEIAYKYLQDEIASAKQAQPTTVKEYEDVIGRLEDFTEEVVAMQDYYAELCHIVNVLVAFGEVTSSSENIDIAAEATKIKATVDIDAKYGVETIQGYLSELYALRKSYFDTLNPITVPLDVTDIFIVNPTPTASSFGWEVVKNASSWSNTFDIINNCAEFWGSAGASLSQTMTLPAGSYRLTAQVFTRTNMNATLFAGDASMYIVTVENTDINNRTQACEWFDADNGYNDLEFVLGQSSDITIGIVADSETSDYWTVWRGFHLVMLPEGQVTTYAINTVADHGRIEIEGGKTAAAAGETVKFNVIGTDGWAPYSFEITTADGAPFTDYTFDGGTIIFQMPAMPVTITGIYKKWHTITVAEAEGGTISVACPGTPEGQSLEGFEVYVTAVPDEGYEVDTIIVSAATPGTLVEVLPTPAADGGMFIMPDDDVTVEVFFRFMGGEPIVGLLGDANCDGSVDVVDVTTVVDFILGKAQPTADQFANADVNRDNSVDVVDLTSIVSIILGTYVPNDGTAAGVKGLMPSSDILALDGTGISLVNSRDYTAFQMDVTLADGATLRGVELGDRAADHSVTYSRIADNTYRIVAYSLSGAAFSGINGKLIALDIMGNGQFTIDNALFSDGQHGYTLGIDAATGIAGMKMNNASGAVYDLSGRRVANSTSDILHSRKGIYIVNGKTVLVK